MFRRKLYILFLSTSLLTGCYLRQNEYVDFTDIEAAAGLSFKVIGQSETDLSQGLPDYCYLPDGTPVNQYQEQITIDDSEISTDIVSRKTTSTTATGLIAQLLKYGNQNRVVEIIGTYPSLDSDLKPIILSGKVMLPRGRKPKRMILVSHYTICSDAEAPSNSFALEGVLVKMGYGLIIPDYIGYGVTADRLHPYLVMDLTARNVIDMYLAVRPWLKAVGMEPEYDDIYLMGYSQGGATSMAVEHLIETQYCYPQSPDYIKVHRVFAGGGPYDVKATYERCVTTDISGYPVAIPLVLQGMIKGNDLEIRLEDMLQEWLYQNIDEWINSKRYTSDQINQLIGTSITHKILTPEGMDRTSDKVAELYKAMTMNSIISYNWLPKEPVYIMHSMDDEIVPYTNATNAKAKWKDANIMYNFGHYGSHTSTCIRFIYSVQALIKQEEKEMKIYE